MVIPGAPQGRILPSGDMPLVAFYPLPPEPPPPHLLLKICAYLIPTCLLQNFPAREAKLQESLSRAEEEAEMHLAVLEAKQAAEAGLKERLVDLAAQVDSLKVPPSQAWTKWGSVYLGSSGAPYGCSHLQGEGQSALADSIGGIMP